MGDQGAALLTKYPIYREDIQLHGTFEAYMKAYYDSWVVFARQRGHGDIKPVLVTGVDMTRDFAMMAYSNDDDGLEAEFTTSASSAASPWGTWRTTGTIHTRCGPQSCRPPTPTRTADMTPSDNNRTETVSDVTPPDSGRTETVADSGLTETISDEYNNCVFVRYFTVRKRLGIPKVIKAAAGPHVLASWEARDDEESLLEAERGSDSGSDSGFEPSLFDGDEDDGSSVSSVESESDVVIHNIIPVRCLPWLSSFLHFSPILIDHP